MVEESWNMLMVEAHLFHLSRARSKETTHNRRIKELCLILIGFSMFQVLPQVPLLKHQMFFKNRFLSTRDKLMQKLKRNSECPQIQLTLNTTLSLLLNSQSSARVEIYPSTKTNRDFSF